MYSQVSGTSLRSNVSNFIRCRLYPRSKFIVILVAGLHVDQRNILHALLLSSVHCLIMSVHYQFLIYCYRVAWPEPILVEFIYVVRCLSEVHLERYMVPVYLVWVLAIFCFFTLSFLIPPDPTLIPRTHPLRKAGDRICPSPTSLPLSPRRN